MNGIDPDSEGNIVLTPPDIGAASNQNLLINWDFADPVNQRLASSYSIRNYIIDRWIMGWLPTDLPEGAVFTPHFGEYSEWSGKNSWLLYRFPNAELTGRMMTMSVLLTDGTLLSGSAVYNFVDDMSVIQLFFNVPGVMYAYANSDDTAGQWRIVLVNTSESPLQIFAVKLELGPVQTLAHRDPDGKWILNDAPPNKVLELLKCQRYFLRLPGEGSSYTLIGHGKATSNSQLDLQFPIPTAMRVRPSVRMTVEWVAVGAGMYEAFTAENMTVVLSSIGTAEACIIISGFTSLIPNHVYTIQRNNDGTGNIDLSSEI